MAETNSENAVLRSTAALLEQDRDVAEAFLLASVYVVALRRGDSPRDVCESLFKAVPPADAWPALRDSLLEAAGGD